MNMAEWFEDEYGDRVEAKIKELFRETYRKGTAQGYEKETEQYWYKQDIYDAKSRERVGEIEFGFMRVYGDKAYYIIKDKDGNELYSEQFETPAYFLLEAEEDFAEAEKKIKEEQSDEDKAELIEGMKELLFDHTCYDNCESEEEARYFQCEKTGYSGAPYGTCWEWRGIYYCELYEKRTNGTTWKRIEYNRNDEFIAIVDYIVEGYDEDGEEKLKIIDVRVEA